MTKVSFTEAYKEAKILAKPDDPIIQTIDIQTIDIQTDNVYYNMQYTNCGRLILTVDEKGNWVHYYPVKFKINEPSQGVSQVPKIEISIMNVIGKISYILDSLLGTRDRIEVVYRAYTEKTLMSGPQISPPPRYQVVRVYGSEELTLVLEPLNLAKVAFPRELHEKLY